MAIVQSAVLEVRRDVALPGRKGLIFDSHTASVLPLHTEQANRMGGCQAKLLVVTISSPLQCDAMVFQ